MVMVAFSAEASQQLFCGTIAGSLESAEEHYQDRVNHPVSYITEADGRLTLLEAADPVGAQ